MALEKEYEFYKANKAKWVAEGKEGQYVVIHREDVLGFYPDIEAASGAGYDAYGLHEPFMTHKVAAVEPVIVISRRIRDAVRVRPD